MSGSERLYVRAKSPKALEGVIPGWLDAELDLNCEFAALSNADEWSPIARQLSATGLEVIELGFHSGVGAFRFAHWVRGKITRELQHGWEDEGAWETVEGKAEPWEDEVFDEPPVVGESSAGAGLAAEAIGTSYRLTGWYFGRTPAKKKAAPKKAAPKKAAPKKAPKKAALKKAPKKPAPRRASAR